MARDPNRIYKFCNQLANLWVTYCPDWRFCQLIHNVFYSQWGNDPFYLEEDEAMTKLENVLIGIQIKMKENFKRDNSEKMLISVKEYEDLIEYKNRYEGLKK